MTERGVEAETTRHLCDLYRIAVIQTQLEG